MRTVAIIGKAHHVGAVRPSGTVSERWGINDLPTRLDEGWAFDGWDRWFDVHTEAHIKKHRPEAWEWYRGQGRGSRSVLSVYGVRPIYLHAAHPEIQGSVAYPRETIQAAFRWDGHDEEFFTSSLDWMMALAIYEGFQRIELYGVDLWDAPHERGEQRNGAHAWIYRAVGMGIDVHIPDASSLCKTDRLYGYFTETSARNFSSVSVDRFFAQLKEAERMKDPAYVAPGLDTPVLAQ